MYNTSTFLQYAKQEIDSDIKDSSIEDARKLIILNKKLDIRKMELAKMRSTLQFVNERIEELNKELQHTEVELQKTNSYRSKLYNESTVDDIRDYAHNLAYQESDLEENISLLKKKISTLHQYKSTEEAKFNYYMKEIQKEIE